MINQNLFILSVIIAVKSFLNFCLISIKNNVSFNKVRWKKSICRVLDPNPMIILYLRKKIIINHITIIQEIMLWKLYLNMIGNMRNKNRIRKCIILINHILNHNHLWLGGKNLEARVYMLIGGKNLSSLKNFQKHCTSKMPEQEIITPQKIKV